MLKYWPWLKRSFRMIALFAFMVLAMPRSDLEPADLPAQVRAYTRQIEFDYIAWGIDAILLKLSQIGLGSQDYLPAKEHAGQVVDYLGLTAQIYARQSQIAEIYADPAIGDPEAASADLRQDLDALQSRQAQIAPLAEAILQNQLSEIAAEMGLTWLGQPLPPVQYQMTELPASLIVSPRSVIRQDAHISILPLPLDERVALEERVDQGLDVSSLVVNVGGIGMYPTMVMPTSNLNWLAEVIAHEWAHNYFTLQPLGASYGASPELRTMNETAASIVGNEMGAALIERFYPELVPPPLPEAAAEPTPTTTPDLDTAPPFNFRAEMHTTRVIADEMLASGQVADAEAYLEARRQFFWENGFRIRKLNQAYFAFYGAYADSPGGAAGADPVGAAVRQLRAQSPTLADFIKQIAWMWSFEQLQAAVSQE